MMKLKRGINLGGYLSQCVHTVGHYRTFIRESDIEKIAEMGFDHIRVPIDVELLETRNGKTKEKGYTYIDNLVSWTRKYKLNMILNMHKVYGYDFNDAGNFVKNNLFINELLQRRFIDLWIVLSIRYGAQNHVAFELLDEIVEDENEKAWNKLVDKTVNAIRSITENTYIIYGGIRWNSPLTLKKMDKPKHKNIIYTFHFYEPLLFTHQRAYWIPSMEPDKEIPYPDSMENYKIKSKKLGIQGMNVIDSNLKEMGKEYIREIVKKAVDAATKAEVPLYCGEFGVIDSAPVEDTYRWFADVNSVFEEFQIGYAIWTYKEMDFGVTDYHYDVIKDELLELWNGSIGNGDVLSIVS